MIRPLLVLGLGALFVGCDVKDTGADDTNEPDDTDTGSGIATEVNLVGYACSSDNEEWTYEVELIGWGSEVDLDIYQYEGGYEWAESHVLDQGDSDPDGTWDKFDITLPMVYDWDDQVDSVNTLYTCDMEETLTWMVTAFDMDGYFADCAVWGDDISVYASFGCWEVQF